MKKFFSLIALVGVFAACQPEELKTVFESAPAQLTIKVGKVYNAVNGADLTAVATKDGDVVINGTPAIAKGSQKMGASWGGVRSEVNVDYPDIVADTDPMTITAADIWIPGNKGNYKIEVKEGPATETEEVSYLINAKYSHNDATWFENANDYVLIDTYTYPEYSGSELDGAYTVIEDVFEADVEVAYNAKKDDKIESEDKEGTVKVSAWALYNVKLTTVTKVTEMQVIATPDPAGSAPTVGTNGNGIVGTFKVKSMVATPEKVEVAHPGHATHYVAPTGDEEATGHGVHHGTHGDGSNAGGGFAEAE